MDDPVGHLVRAGAGRTVHLGNIILSFKDVAAAPLGACSICVSESQPGSGAAPHRHWSYGEWHIILEGKYKCRLGNEIHDVVAGDMVYAPPGSVHGFRNVGEGTGRQLLISWPPNHFEAFMTEIAGGATDTGRPGSGSATDFRRIAASYGVEFVDTDI